MSTTDGGHVKDTYTDVMWALGSYGQLNANVWGSKKQDKKYEANFNKFFDDAKKNNGFAAPVIRLECDGCDTTHRTVYYARKNQVLPKGFSLYKTLIMQWTKTENELGKDMYIAS